MASILIVEDEVLFAEDISQLLKEEGHTVCGVANNPIQALQLMKTEYPDIILMDINLNHEIDGIQLIKLIKEDYKNPFIFMSAYSDQKIIDRAKKTKPWGYVLKPINEKELLITIELVLFKITSRSQGSDSETLKNEHAADEYLFLKRNNQRHKIYLADIQWVEAESNYSVIITEDGSFTASLTLKKLEEKINFGQLLRVHRKYLVNLDKVDVIATDYVVINGSEVPIGNSYRAELRKKIKLI